MLISMQIRVRVEQDQAKLSQAYTRPFIIGLIDSPRPTAVPITPQAVPSRFESTRREMELPRTVYMLPAIRLRRIRKVTTTIQSQEVTSSAEELLGSKQSMAIPTADKEVQTRILALLKVGLKASILPKMRATMDPATQGMMSRLPVVTQSILKRLMIRSLRLVKMHMATQLTTIPKMIIQNNLGIYSRQLALNYYSTYYSPSLWPDSSSDSSFARFSFLVMMTEMTTAATTARESTAEATYQGRLMDLVLSKMRGARVTLSASKRKGRLSPNPIIVSYCSDAYRAITKPCIVQALDPAIPVIARIAYTPQMQPSGRKSKSRAMANSDRKLLMAMTRTVTFMGYLSSTIPRGISVNMTGRQVEKYSRLISMELRLQGSSLSGASRACGISVAYPQPMTTTSPMIVITLSSNFIIY